MAVGLVGRKSGMSRVFTDEGESVPVTVIQALPNRVTRIKTEDSDGYSALQVTTGTVKQSRVSKPLAGRCVLEARRQEERSTARLIRRRESFEDLVRNEVGL